MTVIPALRFSTQCTEIGGKSEHFPTFWFSTKCREIGKQGEDFPFCLDSALNVGK